MLKRAWFLASLQDLIKQVCVFSKRIFSFLTRRDCACRDVEGIKTFDVTKEHRNDR